MIKTTNENVAKNWTQGIESVSTTGNYRTDGLNLYSYTTRIGFTTVNGQKVLGDFTKRGGRFLSVTTSTKHIPPATNVAQMIVHPDDFDTLVKEGEMVTKPKTLGSEHLRNLQCLFRRPIR